VGCGLDCAAEGGGEEEVDLHDISTARVSTSVGFVFSRVAVAPGGLGQDIRGGFHDAISVVRGARQGRGGGGRRT
jgi:hypothetical protein